MPQFIWKGTRVKQVEQQQQQKKASTDEMSKIWDPESKKCNQQKAGNGKSKEKNWREKQNWGRTSVVHNEVWAERINKFEELKRRRRTNKHQRSNL